MIDDFELDLAGRIVDERLRKSGEAIIHVKGHARLGGCKSVGDPGSRIDRAKIVEQRLIGDFTGQPDVLRLQDCGLTAHERAPPVRRCARDMRDSARRGTCQEIDCRLARAREHQRRPRQHRAQINLQAAVAANIVERAPNRFRAGRHLRRQSAAETLQGMHDELRRSRGPRGQQNPLGGHARPPLDAPGKRPRRHHVGRQGR